MDFDPSSGTTELSSYGIGTEFYGDIFLCRFSQPCIPPTPFAMTGGGTYCAGGTGMAIGLLGSQTGVNYQLQKDGSDLGEPLAGTGIALNFGTFTAEGTYTVVAKTTLDGCTGSMTGSAVVSVTPVPTPTITWLSADYCQDAGAVTLTGTPSGGSFTIDGNSATQLNPANLSVGNHTVRYTLTQNGCTTFIEQSVEIKALPNASFSHLIGLYCADAAAVTLTPTTPGGTFSGPGISGSIFTPANAGSGGTITYTVTANGCTSASSQSVTVNPLPSVNAGPDQSVILGFGSNCTSLSATPSVGSGYNYTWSPGGQADSPITICPQMTTTYTVTLTNGNGCQATDHVIVNVKDVRCGPGLQNVSMCYYGLTICVPQSYVARYQSIGATLGACGAGNTRISYEAEAATLSLSLKPYPNPVADAMRLEVLAPQAGPATFEVLDMTGRARQTRRENLVEGLNEIEFRLGTLPTGTYLIRAVDALGRQGTTRVSKQ